MPRRPVPDRRKPGAPGWHLRSRHAHRARELPRLARALNVLGEDPPPRSSALLADLARVVIEDKAPRARARDREVVRDLPQVRPVQAMALQLREDFELDLPLGTGSERWPTDKFRDRDGEIREGPLVETSQPRMTLCVEEQCFLSGRFGVIVADPILEVVLRAVDKRLVGH